MSRIGKIRLTHVPLSPFSKMLLAVSSGLNSEETSKLRLALVVDRHTCQRDGSLMKHSADMLLHMVRVDMLSHDDTYFLRQFLVQIGRRDLEAVVLRYDKHRISEEKMKRLNEAGESCSATGTIPQPSSHASSIPLSSVENRRPSPEGLSIVPVAVATDNTEKKLVFTDAGKTEEISCSPMAIDDGNNSSQSSQMSISDDDKVSLSHQKNWGTSLLDTSLEIEAMS